MVSLVLRENWALSHGPPFLVCRKGQAVPSLYEKSLWLGVNKQMPLKHILSSFLQVRAPPDRTASKGNLEQLPLCAAQFASCRSGSVLLNWRKVQSALVLSQPSCTRPWWCAGVQCSVCPEVGTFRPLPPYHWEPSSHPKSKNRSAAVMVFWY